VRSRQPCFWRLGRRRVSGVRSRSGACRFIAAAHIKVVEPPRSVAFTSAPFSINACRTARFWCMNATNMGGEPRNLLSFGSARQPADAGPLRSRCAVMRPTRVFEIRNLPRREKAPTRANSIRQIFIVSPYVFANSRGEKAQTQCAGAGSFPVFPRRREQAIVGACESPVKVWIAADGVLCSVLRIKRE